MLVDDGLWTEVGFSGSGRGRKWALRRGVKTLVFLRLQPAQAHAGRSGRYQSVADCNASVKLGKVSVVRAYCAALASRVRMLLSGYRVFS